MLYEQVFELYNFSLFYDDKYFFGRILFLMHSITSGSLSFLKKMDCIFLPLLLRNVLIRTMPVKQSTVC